MNPSPSGSLYTRFVANYAFPVHEWLKGHDSVRKLEELEKSQWLSAAELARLQATRLGEFLDRVRFRHEPWRQALEQAGVTPSRFGDATALQSLPPASKERMRSLAALWRPLPGERYRFGQTSGSTGEPLQFPLGMERIVHDVAAKWRATRWWGVDIGDREIVVWASPRETASQTRIKNLRDSLLRSRLLPIRVVDAATARRHVEAIQRYSPRMMFGYPSMLSQLGRVAAETCVRPEVPPRVVFTTSEILRPQWRAAIEAGFGARVADEYGARDAGFLARECPAGRLHVNAEDILLEIVGPDGRRLPDGEVGQVLVTNLTTALFPFIRYRTGDVGSLDPIACPCGRAHPVIRELLGRANDCLVRRDGALVHGSAFNYVLRALPGLEAYQIRQTAVDRVEVLIRASDAIAASERARIESEYRSLLDEDVVIEVLQVPGFEPDPRGKHRHVICEVEVGTPDDSLRATSGRGDAARRHH